MTNEKKEKIKSIINWICTVLSAIAAGICSGSCVTHIIGN